jgi:hypothetical protein
MTIPKKYLSLKLFLCSEISPSTGPIHLARSTDSCHTTRQLLKENYFLPSTKNGKRMRIIITFKDVKYKEDSSDKPEKDDNTAYSEAKNIQQKSKEPVIEFRTIQIKTEAMVKQESTDAVIENHVDVKQEPQVKVEPGRKRGRPLKKIERGHSQKPIQFKILEIRQTPML